VNAYSCDAGPMLERMSLCIFQLDKAEKVRLTRGVRGIPLVVFEASRKAICGLPVLAGRAADPLRPHSRYAEFDRTVGKNNGRKN
jgi:hypothetical protein